MPQKFGPIIERKGSALYPGFTNTVPPNAGRIQRLEYGEKRTQRGVIRPTKGKLSKFPTSVLIKAGGLTNQKVNLAHVNVRKVGSVPPQGNTFGFAYTSTTSSITWYWDGTNGSAIIVIHRSDGSNFTVPTAGSGFTVSGLASNTTYYFLPFWNTTNVCNIGWVGGTVGSPQVAFILTDTNNNTTTSSYLTQQNMQQNEPLSGGFMSAATTASGSGGGGGGGAGCVMAGTDIEPLGGSVPTIQILPELTWLHIETPDGRYLNCTLDHPLYHAVRGKTKARDLQVGDFVITDRGEQELIKVQQFHKKCSKHRVEMKEGHLFWANGFLSHNMKIFHNPSP